MATDPKEKEEGKSRSDALTDLALTVPVFVLYHLGVAFLPVVNAADPVTAELRALAAHSLPMYAALTVGIGLVFASLVWMFGSKGAFEKKRFAWIAVEGVLYATLMRFGAAAAVGALTLGPISPAGPLSPPAGALDVPLAEAQSAAADTLARLTLSLGAGFYEEAAFRGLLFGGGAWLLRGLFSKSLGADVAVLGWAVATAAAFSAWHYVGANGDAWDLSSFVFRWACGMALTLVYWFRGFAPAVWAHALYDVWALTM